MILFISSWHLVALLGVFLGSSAFLVATGILWVLVGIHNSVTHELAEEDQAKREKRSAAAKQGHRTRAARRQAELAAEPDIFDDEVERVLRQLDEQAEAKQTDDALKFVQRGEE